MTSSSETLIDKEETSNLEAGVSVGAVRGRNVYELTSRRQTTLFFKQASWF